MLTRILHDEQRTESKKWRHLHPTDIKRRHITVYAVSDKHALFHLFIHIAVHNDVQRKYTARAVQCVTADV